MRLWIFSDLHLETGLAPRLPKAAPACDVVIVAGDVAGSCAKAIAFVADEPLLRDLPIIYVPGNHDLFDAVLQDGIAEGLAMAERVNRTRTSHIHMLAHGSLTLGSVRFIGAALWTNYSLAKTPKPSMIRAGKEMSDHQRIWYREPDGHIACFMPWHTKREHDADLEILVTNLAASHNGPTMVVTHHLPSPASIPARFQCSALNPTFACDLGWVIERFSPQLWVHGHSHDACAYQRGSTRIFCNPQGYPLKEQALCPEEKLRNGFQPDLVMAV
jgi:Icc-related predicted phosphoesterase